MNGDKRKMHVDVDDLTTYQKTQANRWRRRESARDIEASIEEWRDAVDDARYDHEIRLADEAEAKWRKMYPGERYYRTFKEWEEWDAEHREE